MLSRTYSKAAAFFTVWFGLNLHFLPKCSEVQKEVGKRSSITFFFRFWDSFGHYFGDFSSRPWRNLPPHMGDPHGDPQTGPQHADPHGFLKCFSVERHQSMWIGVLWAGLRVAMWITHVGGKFRHGLLEKSLIFGHYFWRICHFFLPLFRQTLFAGLLLRQGD